MPSGRHIPRWWAPGDWSAFFGLALDNTTQLVILSSLLIGVFKFPPDLVLGRMVPGTAAGVLVGDVVYTILAVRLMRRTGRDDVTAMPLGLNAPSVFGMSFAVLGPAYLATGDEKWLVYPVTRDDQESRYTMDLMPGYTFTPDAKSLLVTYGGKIHRLDVATGADPVIPPGAPGRLAARPPRCPGRVPAHRRHRRELGLRQGRRYTPAASNPLAAYAADHPGARRLPERAVQVGHGDRPRVLHRVQRVGGRRVSVVNVHAIDRRCSMAGSVRDRCG